jgi:ubiquinone/menaquinone biosynthesis C-methylase UbiE
MNNNWSQYVQTTDELYKSRSLRFTDDNKRLWLSAIGVKDGMNVLEIGCAGGIFCHRIKSYLPNTKVTGLDFDIGHIEYAKVKTDELGLDCEFVNGDATDMPFPDNTFDLCYSHTVIEHLPTDPFLKEQYRVLKPGGQITVLSVRSRLGVKDENWFIRSEEETALFEKAWNKAENFDKEHGIGSYELTEHDFPKVLEKSGFNDINVDFITIVDYAPDNASVSDETALAQINTHRLHVIASLEKALRIAPDGLYETEKRELLRLINARFDKRIEQYKSGEKIWDFSTSTVLAASGRK